MLAKVCAPREPIVAARRRYRCRKLTYDWRMHVPSGFAIEWADAALLEKGFGFVALARDASDRPPAIAAHAVIDCIVDGVGDIGLFTTEMYRRRGLATVTSAAAIEYGLAHGLDSVNWDCGENNIGSLRTAEKLGFQRVGDHTMYVLV